MVILMHLFIFIILFIIYKAMSIKYKKGEFCISKNCKYHDNLMSGDKSYCYQCKAYQYHDYLNKNNYSIKRW